MPTKIETVCINGKEISFECDKTDEGELWYCSGAHCAIIPSEVVKFCEEYNCYPCDFPTPKEFKKHKPRSKRDEIEKKHGYRLSVEAVSGGEWKSGIYDHFVKFEGFDGRKIITFSPYIPTKYMRKLIDEKKLTHYLDLGCKISMSKYNLHANFGDYKTLVIEYSYKNYIPEEFKRIISKSDNEYFYKFSEEFCKKFLCLPCPTFKAYQKLYCEIGEHEESFRGIDNDGHDCYSLKDHPRTFKNVGTNKKIVVFSPYINTENLKKSEVLQKFTKELRQNKKPANWEVEIYNAKDVNVYFDMAVHPENQNYLTTIVFKEV